MSNNQYNLDNLKIIDNRTIPASGVLTSDFVNTNQRKLMGNISIQIQVTGTGTVKLEWSQSNSFNESNGIGDFVKPSAGHTIVTGFTAASGSDSNGKDILSVPMINCMYFKIICTETGGANSAVVNAWLSLQ